MPVTPNLVERTLLLGLNLGPGPMLDMLGLMSFSAVHAALKLRLFDTLADGPMTAADVARRLPASERGVALLLAGLEPLGYVRCRGDRWENTAMTAKWMLRDSPDQMVDTLLYMGDITPLLYQLDEAVREGKPRMTAWEWFDQHEGGWDLYHGALIGLAHMTADAVVSKVALPPTARRLLDVGGGHGLYSIRFCRACPDLEATIFDWPQSLAVARKTIAAEKMGDRVSVQEGDFWKDDLGKGYDAALLFNVIHMYDASRAEELFRRVAAALNAGGVLVVLDQMAVKTSGNLAKIMTGLTGLSLFNFVNGQSHRPADVRGWMASAGFAGARWLPLPRAPGFALVMGTKTS